MKIALTVLLFFSTLSSQATTPEARSLNNPGICSYYLEKSKELGCAKTNYLTHFGFKYCQLFIDKEKNYTRYAQGVLSKIRSCLVNHLAKTPQLRCENVNSIAASSHIDCYVENDFCKLKPKDGLTTLWYVKSELRDPLFRSTMMKIADRCRSRIFKTN